MNHPYEDDKRPNTCTCGAEVPAYFRTPLDQDDWMASHERADSLHPAIAETISIGQDAPLPEGTQRAYHAVVHLVVPGTDHEGNPISDAGASDWIAETLRDQFLDWGYVREHADVYTSEQGDLQSPISITVCKPYIEGTFLNDVES